jgi:hypothetical protein
MIRTIPLNKLVSSPRNVRRATDEQANLELETDIEARGLLQNLIVTSAPKPAEPKGPDVEAGPGAKAADDGQVIGEDASPAAKVEEMEEA